MFVIHPEFAKEFKLKKLIAYMDTAIQLVNDLNYYDTKASVYALADDFKNAIQCEEVGITVKYDPDNALADAKEHLEWFKKGINIQEGEKTKKVKASLNNE